MLRSATVAVLAGLGFSVCATATPHARLFWALEGLTGAQDVMTEQDFLPYWETNYPVEITELDPAATAGGRRIYLWIQFLEHPQNIFGFTAFDGGRFALTGTAPFDDGVVYRHRKSIGHPSIRWHRWDGGWPITLNDGFIMSGVAGGGVLSYPGDHYVPGMSIFDLGTGLHFVIGSTVVTNAQPGQTLVCGAGPEGLTMRNLGGLDFPAEITPATLTFSGSPAVCGGDMNCDGAIGFDDIDLFVEALGFPGGQDWPYACPWLAGDADGDQSVGFGDIDPFVALIGQTCP